MQAEGPANVFSTTTTHSKPVRSKPGVLLRSTLRYGKADDKLVLSRSSVVHVAHLKVKGKNLQTKHINFLKIKLAYKITIKIK